MVDDVPVDNETLDDFMNLEIAGPTQFFEVIIGVGCACVYS
jgi:hypothetical protein